MSQYSDLAVSTRTLALCYDLLTDIGPGARSEEERSVTWTKSQLSLHPSQLLHAETATNSEPSPWSRQERPYVSYKKVEDLQIDDLSYYRPLSPVHPLFDSAFFQRFASGNRVVLWVLQMTTRSDHNGVSSGFAIIADFKKRARHAWPGARIEVKYVLVAPHQKSGFNVVWKFAKEFNSHKGDVYVQFLDISSFSASRCKIEDIIGEPTPEVLQGDARPLDTIISTSSEPTSSASDTHTPSALRKGVQEEPEDSEDSEIEVPLAKMMEAQEV
ncbi:hypothetical protein V8D89_013420 [Ganoderma adspersum]